MLVAAKRRTNMFRTLSKTQVAILCAILLIGIAVIGTCLAIFLATEEIAYRGAVVTNGHECAEIASSIIHKGGSAVDAAIAAMFCEGVAMPQSTGLGGGFFMTIYKKSNGAVRTLDAREVAPLLAHEDMYDGNATLSARGGLSIAVPGELMGYWVAHQEFGLLDWKELIQPTIDLCRKGHIVTPYLAKMFIEQEVYILGSPTLREVFIDRRTNRTYPLGAQIKREKLAETLEIIAAEGARALYNGTLTKQFVADIQANGGIISEEDMMNYRPQWLEPIEADLPFNHKLYSFPIPGSGVILAYILNILKDFLDYASPDSITNYQRIVESFKFGYGKRTELGDQNFVDIEELIANLTSSDYGLLTRSMIMDNVTFQDPQHYGANMSLVEDHGTAHISILAPNGDAVSVTGTINLYFGSRIRSRSTGIILNDEMDDFSAPNITNYFGVPPSPANYIVPRKRPLSSMCPSIILNEEGDVRMVLGAAGGTKITTTSALVVIRHLWFDLPLQDVINMKRFHHQLFPMSMEFEEGYDMDIVRALQDLGHNVTLAPADGFSALTAISKNGDDIVAVTDPRRLGSVSYIV